MPFVWEFFGQKGNLNKSIKAIRGKEMYKREQQTNYFKVGDKNNETEKVQASC